MKQKIDVLIINAGQLCTMPLHDNAPQRGHDLGDLGMIENGAVAIHEGKILEVGTDLENTYDATTTINANGKLVTPGLVDAHTHVVWAGNRANEFERRIAGATYQEIMAEGGGINATMQAVRNADLTTLIEESKLRINRMIQHGTTTIECKTGYGLSTEDEIKTLNAIALLDTEMLVDLVPTFLGAHAVPPEFKDNPDGYVEVIVNEMIPAVAIWKSEHWSRELFCDVFCETGAFSVEQSRRIFEAAKLAGLKLKIHSDEFDALGGTRLAVEMGATSADHLVATTLEEIALLGQSSTIAVSMPPTPFGLGHHHYTPAQDMLDANVALVIATDCNPGTAWGESLQLVMALATRYLKLTQAQALACVTVNAAFAVERGGEIGTLTEGALGDVVIWQVDDYRQLGYRFGTNLVDRVIKQGEVIFQA